MNTTSQASSIDQVIEEMDRIIERCIREKSKLGYFAVLYRNVTAEVKDRIKAGYFEDGARMEHLDVVFAKRYLDAIHLFWQGKKPSKSWQVAFSAAAVPSPIILQHLMLGMNAHINLDLAIATAQVAPGVLLPKIKNDFNRIMNLLSDMIDEIEDRIEKVSPTFRIIDQIGGRGDEKFAGFAINKARDIAWNAAEKFAVACPAEFNKCVLLHDQVVAVLGNGIANPGLAVKAALKIIQVKESTNVPEVIKTLHT